MADFILPQKNLSIGYQEFAEMDMTDIKPSFSEVLGASWRLHNPIGSYLANRAQAEELGAIADTETTGHHTYNPINDERWSTPEQLQAILASKSRAESGFILDKLNKVQEDRQVLQETSFVGALGPMALTQLVNPFNLVFGSASGIRSAIRLGLYAGALEELQYKLDQNIRPVEEMASMVMFNGAFFGAAKGVQKLIGPSSASKVSDDILDDLGDELDNSIPDPNVLIPGSLQPTVTTLDTFGDIVSTPTKTLKNQIDVPFQNIYNKGSQRVKKFTIETTRQQDKLKYQDAPTPVRILDRLQEIINPRSKLANSMFINSRKIVYDLLETPGYMTRNIEEGLPTPTAVQSLIKGHEGALVKLINNIETNFRNYRIRLRDEEGIAFIDSASIFGKIVSPLRDKLGGNVGALNVNEFRAMVTKGLKTESAGFVDKELIDSVKQVRKFLDDYAIDAKAVGILDEASIFNNYVPRMWNVMEVVKRRGELVNRILKHQEAKGLNKLTRKEVEDKVDAIINSGSNMENFRVSGPRGIFSERTLDIDDLEFEDFLITDIDDILKSYVRVASADIELARKYGSVDMKAALASIRNEGEKAIAKLDPIKDKDKIVKIAQQIDDDIQITEALRDILRGIYGLPENPYSLSSRAGRIALDFNNLIALGGATISSIPDLVRIAATGNLTDTMNAMKLMTAHWSKFKAARGEVKLAGTALDMILQTRALALYGNGNVAPRFTKLESGLSYAVNGFFIANLLSPWNAFLKQTTGVIITNNIIKQSIRWSKGTVSDLNKSKLLALGLDETDAKLISKLHQEFGEVVDGVYMPNVSKWEETIGNGINQATIESLRKKFNAGLVKKVDETIVTPGAGDQPLWVHNQWGKFISQYKSFAFAAANKVLVPSMQQRDAHQIMGLMMMTYLGGHVQSMKDSLNNKDKKYSTEEFVLNGLNRSGALGIYMEFNNIIEAISGYGINSIATGQREPTFPARQLGAIAPVLGTGTNIVNSILGDGKTPIPGQSLFYIELMGLNNLRNNFDKINGN